MNNFVQRRKMTINMMNIHDLKNEQLIKFDKNNLKE